MPGFPLLWLVRRLPAGAADTDADLLARFARDRDDAAFELLVWRHGALVLGACRRALGQHEDAEDAFQATFLVLARKAGGVSAGAALPAWLHRVAVRLSRRAARRRGMVAQASRPVEEVAAPPAPDPVEQADTAAAVDAEIDRLPERLRRAVVLCYLEGLTAAEAGKRLGCPTGTVESRLATARKLMRVRLMRRGVTASVGVIGGSVTLAPEVVAKVTRAGRAFVRDGPRATADIIGEPAVRLAKGGLTMTGPRLWTATTAGVAAVAVAAGIGWADKPTPPVTKTADPPPKAAEAKPADPAKAESWPLARKWTLNGSLVGVTPDGRSLVLLHPQEVVGFDLTTGTGSRFAVRSPNAISDAAVSPDGKWLATAEGVNGVKVRELPSGKLVEALWPTGGLPATGVAFTPDGSRLVVLGTRSETPERRGGFQGGGQPGALLGGLTSQPGGPLGLLGGQPGGVQGMQGMFGGQPSAPPTVHYQLSVWDAATYKAIGQPGVTVSGEPGTAHRIALAGGRYALVMVPRFKAAKPRDGVNSGGTAPPPELTPDGTAVTVLDTVTGASDKRFVVREGLSPATGVGVAGTVSPDGRSILATDQATPAELVVIDTAGGKERFRLAGLRRPIRAAAYSPDGRWIAAATGTSTSRPAPKGGWGTGGPGSGRPSAPAEDEVAGPSAVIIWDAGTGREVARMIDKETIRNYVALRFARDGSFLVAQDTAGTVTVWGRPPEPEPAKPAATTTPKSAAPATPPDRFAALLAGLSADGTTDARRVEAVFLAALGRLPTDVEAKSLAAQLGRQTDKPAALRDLLDTLVGTAEFKAHAAALGQLAK